MQQYDVTAIKEMIPHRYPFLLVDKVVDIVKGESCTGIKCVTINEPFFPGHFPDKPVMPGVLILEAMAQTAGVLAVDSLGEDAKGSKAVFFMGIDGAKFRKTVEPGDRLEMKITVLRGGGAVWKFQGEAYVEGTKVCEATLTAMMGAN
ncbi:3-hydroxyacyl-ACP dehydratase FabZ [Pseudokordiimonas caeni]|uniref:3-hydroxyacyl-ACP dehydratase FabZ n=1 Tax=Pseudokordiimonas caeni TaxID=2997908 RepID=UPI002811B9E0|nr:3-hydroxyacyl-ACP dehydratase FabZ [Pseudokordiimonas caeni]